MKRPDTPWYNKYNMQLRDDPARRMRDRPRKGHWNLELEVQVEKFYTDVLGLTDEGLLKTLTALTEVRALKRREVLVETGARQQEVVFVLEGVLRGYYLDMNGREITDCFVVQCGTPAMSSFTLDTPSPISIEALTDCRVLHPDRGSYAPGRTEYGGDEPVQPSLAAVLSGALGDQEHALPAQCDGALSVVPAGISWPDRADQQ